MLHKFIEILTLPQGLASSDSPTFVQITVSNIVTASGNLTLTPAANADIILHGSGIGHVGIGVTSIDTDILGRVLVLGQDGHGLLTASNPNDFIILSNAKYSTGWKYAANGTANLVSIGNTEGKIYFQRAITGVAGNAITWIYDLNITPAGIGLRGITAPTAALHFPAGSPTANTAPIQLTAGPVETVKRAGLIEYNNRFIVTESDITNRYLVQAVASTKTIAGAPYTNDGYVTITINGTDIKVMTTA